LEDIRYASVFKRTKCDYCGDFILSASKRYELREGNRTLVFCSEECANAYRCRRKT